MTVLCTWPFCLLLWHRWRLPLLLLHLRLRLQPCCCSCHITAITSCVLSTLLLLHWLQPLLLLLLLLLLLWVLLRHGLCCSRCWLARCCWLSSVGLWPCRNSCFIIYVTRAPAPSSLCSQSPLKCLYWCYICVAGNLPTHRFG